LCVTTSGSTYYLEKFGVSKDFKIEEVALVLGGA